MPVSVLLRFARGYAGAGVTEPEECETIMPEPLGKTPLTCGFISFDALLGVIGQTPFDLREFDSEEIPKNY